MTTRQFVVAVILLLAAGTAIVLRFSDKIAPLLSPFL